MYRHATRSRRYVVWGAIIAALALGLITSLDHLLIHSADAVVYTVPAVQAGLRQQPRSWVGRTILVQGAVETINQYISGPPGPDGAYTVKTDHLRALLVPRPYPLGPATAKGGFGPQLWADPQVPSHPFNRLLMLLRSVPLVGALVPVHDQRLGFLQTGVFRITVLPRHRCAPGACMSEADVRLDDVQP